MLDDDGLPDPLTPRPVQGRRQIFASGVWIAVSTIVPFLATAVLSVVAGRILGAELLGQQSLIAFAGQLGSALIVTSLTDACIRWLAAYRTGEPERVPGLERWTMRAHAVVGLVPALVLLTIGLTRGAYAAAWAIVAASVFLDALGWGCSSRIIARDGWAPVAQRRLVTQVLAVALGVLAVVAGYGITGIFAANLIGSLVLLILLRPLLKRSDAKVIDRFPRPVVRLWVIFAGSAVLTQVVGGRIEILFLGAFTNGEQIAHYTVALMLVATAMTLPGAIAGASMPAIAAASGAGDIARASEALSRAMRISAVLSLPLTAGIIAAGPAFIVALYGDEFREAASLSRYVALLAVVVPCGRLTSSYWSGLGRLRLPVIAGIAGAVLEVALALALIPRFEAGGAVAATLVGQGTAALVGITLTWRAIGSMPVRLRGWLTCAVASAIATVAGMAAAQGGGLLGAVTGGLTVCAVFLVLAVLAGRAGLAILDDEDGRWLRYALPARLSPLVRTLSGR